MFVQIRGQPFTANGSWIAPGYQNQYGQETQVVAAICERLVYYCSLILMFGRWSLGWVFLDADNGDSYPNVSCASTNASLYMDSRDHDHIFDLGILIQAEKQR